MSPTNEPAALDEYRQTAGREARRTDENRLESAPVWATRDLPAGDAPAPVPAPVAVPPGERHQGQDAALPPPAPVPPDESRHAP